MSQTAPILKFDICSGDSDLQTLSVFSLALQSSLFPAGNNPG